MSGSLTRFGIGKETTYGTAAPVTVPFEILSEDFRGSYQRIQAEALSNSLVDRADRWAPNAKGAAGSVTLEPFTKNFGNLLVFMTGSVATSGPAETAAYTHTGTLDNLTGDALTVQVGRADESGTLRPWTYEGGKVTSFEFSNSVDQTLRCSISMDFAREHNPDAPAGNYAITALNALSLPTGAQVLTSQGAEIRVGGSVIDVSDFSISVDNAQLTDRWFLGQSNKRQPTQDGKRRIEWSFTAPYVNNDYWQKVSSATAAGAHAEIVATWTGLTAISGTTTPLYPKLTITVPYARFDEGGPVVEGPSLLNQSISGIGLYDATNPAVTIEYVTSDTTVLS